MSYEIYAIRYYDMLYYMWFPTEIQILLFVYMCVHVQVCTYRYMYICGYMHVEVRGTTLPVIPQCLTKLELISLG